ncbi:MAG TPA: FAD-binding protein, partial [Ilumatobacteraceae bacterium]|nr:FAD-binding protein [Ilumatobacteraceae bacterium]
KMVPGDLGTKGGLLTDELARVLDNSGTPIEGLYAVGNAAASVMGREYPGGGSTIGPGLTFGYVAAVDVAARLAATTDAESGNQARA